jgi:restriction endonuclease S subunit
VRKKLKDIAEISTGLYKKPDPVGDAFYLQGKHFDKDGMIIPESLIKQDVWTEEINMKYILKDGDILFIAKGDNNRACMYYVEIGKAVPSSLFFIIRVQRDLIIPEFMHWYLNSDDGQSKIQKISKGSYIPSVSKKLFIEVEMEVPAMDIQENIVKLGDLWKREKELTNQRIQWKDKYYQQLFQKKITEK